MSYWVPWYSGYDTGRQKGRVLIEQILTFATLGRPVPRQYIVFRRKTMST